MKVIFISIALTILSTVSFSQIFSEVYIEDGEWQLELVNTQSLEINTLKITAFGTTDTAEVKKTVVDRLNEDDALVLINNDSLLTPLEIKGESYEFIFIVNDTNVYYIFPRFSPSYLDENNVSIVYVDSIPEMYQSKCRFKEYYGIGISSLGKKSEWKDCLSTVKGKLQYNGEVLTNTWFIVGDAWNTKTLKDTLYSDENGFFEFETWPSPVRTERYSLEGSCGSAYKGYGYFIMTVEGLSPYEEFAVLTADKILPGINTIDIKDVTANINELKTSTTLTCSPNPASSYVKVKYSIVETASWKDCSILISNNQGQAVLQTPIETPQGEVEIKLPSTLAKGMYYCSVAYKGQAVKTVQLLISGE